jgi:hypothetical protein
MNFYLDSKMVREILEHFELTSASLRLGQGTDQDNHFPTEKLMPAGSWGGFNNLPSTCFGFSQAPKLRKALSFSIGTLRKPPQVCLRS